MAEEFDIGNTDHRAARPLLVAPQGPGLLRRHGLDASLTVGHEHVPDPFALRGPTGDGRRRAVFHVVWMRDDSKSAFPILWQCLQVRHAVTVSRLHRLDRASTECFDR